MRSRPAHGGYPGDVVVEEPRTTYGGIADANGFTPIGACLFHVEALRVLPIGDVVLWSGCSVEDLRQWAETTGFALGGPGKTTVLRDDVGEFLRPYRCSMSDTSR